ncbi:MAG: hypothetical protein MK085_04110 [Phycisphaerales bacterium]|nr:hypothetical protein [Phycisphaerales bacterium]
MMVQLCKYRQTNPDGSSTLVWRIKYIDENQAVAGVQKRRNTIWLYEDGSIRFSENSAHADGALVWYAQDRYVIEEDLNGDGEVNGADLGLLMANWAIAGSSGDIDGDGDVDGADLGRLLGKWGPVYPDLP